MDLIERLPDRLENELAKVLRPNETVHVKLKGAFKEALVCTDTRVIILKGGFMAGQVFGNDVFQQPYSNIAGVQVKFHLMTGYFELSAGGMQNTNKTYWSADGKTDPAKAPNCVSVNSKKQAERFRDACTLILDKIEESRNAGAANANTSNLAGQSAILEAIKKLGELREAGVLSDEEFSAKKAELLSRL